jgi:hypothetical protein
MPLTEAQRGNAFDQLRRNYPLRREFACYTTEIQHRKPELKEALKALGFEVQTGCQNKLGT